MLQHEMPSVLGDDLALFGDGEPGSESMPGLPDQAHFNIRTGKVFLEI